MPTGFATRRNGARPAAHVRCARGPSGGADPANPKAARARDGRDGDAVHEACTRGVLRGGCGEGSGQSYRRTGSGGGGAGGVGEGAAYEGLAPLGEQALGGVTNTASATPSRLPILPS